MIKRLFLFLILSLFIFIVFSPKTNASYKETELDKKKLFKVTKVIDGDTIMVNIRGKTEAVRLLGIDTPETVDPRKPVQCFGKAASEKMKSLVLGKYVKLIDDKTQGNRDKYNRLLRFVYLPNSVSTFVNGEMVRQGFAFSYKTYPTIYLNKFNNWERNARENNLGLWGSCPLSQSPTPTQKIIKITPTPKAYAPTLKTTTNNNTNISTGQYACDCSKSCGAITSCDEAYYQLNTCGCSQRDGDSDGVPCETLCN